MYGVQLVKRGLLLLSLSTWGVCHPGDSVMGELRARQAYAENKHMGLHHCREKLERSGVITRGLERRKKLWGHTGFDHEVNKGFNLDSDALEVLSTNPNGCVLHPELTEGPYYVEGEQVRSLIDDGQRGAGLLLDLQIIDSDTCEPVDGVYVEVWYTNATGVYSGIVEDGNGTGDKDPKNAYTTFNRGVQKTSNEGVVTFSSVFPGYYGGRAPHVHIMTHIDPHVRADKTIVSNKATHIGQLFFDQGLIGQIRQLPEYKSNKQPFTLNKDDVYFEEARKTSDPIISWARLPEVPQLPEVVFDTVILGWMHVGINMSYVRESYVGGIRKTGNH